MNKLNVVYPDDYTEDDKSDYDMLLAMGQNSIGTTLDKNQEFLLDLAVKMTIREKRGEIQNLSPEEIETMKAIHTQHLEKGLIHETPPDSFYASLLSLKEEYIPEDVKKDIEVVEEEIKKDWVKLSPSPPLTSNIENEFAD
jgi:alpha-L-fucosidase